MLSMLADLRESDKVQHGSKASGLGELIRSGEKISIGFALSLEFFMRFIALCIHMTSLKMFYK